MTRTAIPCILAVCFSSGAFAQSNNQGSAATLDLTRFVVVGDSLSAGVENFSLLDTQQPHGYASVIAAQAGVLLTLPLVPFPGAPNVLELVNPGPPPVIAPAPGTLPFPPRDNPAVQATNLSVPGETIADGLLAPSQIPAQQGPVAGWAEIVLGFPGPPQSQVAEAAALNPTTLLLALGNNDALVPAITGQLSQLTPVSSFQTSYDAVLSSLATTGATLLVVNIPDVTEVPYFTEGKTFAAQAGISMQTLHDVLGVQGGDYLLSSAVPVALNLLGGVAPPPPYSWPGSCPVPIAGLLPPGVPLPCILTKSQADTVRSTIKAYNGTIAQAARTYGATLLDLNSFVDQLSKHGYQNGAYCLTTSFLGGLISLDGIHPTNTGYAIVANEFISTLNSNFRTSIPSVDVGSVLASDPLVFPTDLCPTK